MTKIAPATKFATLSSLVVLTAVVLPARAGEPLFTEPLAASARPDAARVSLGDPWTLDSTRMGLHALAGHPAALLDAQTPGFTLDLGATHTSLSGGSGQEMTHATWGAPAIGFGFRDRAAVRLRWEPIFESIRPAGAGRSKIADHRFLLEAGFATGEGRAFVSGIAIALRPGVQDDPTPAGHGGSWQRVHPRLEGLRLDLGGTIAQTATVIVGTGTSITLDSLEHDTVGPVTAHRRFAWVAVPQIGAGLSIARPEWPVRGIVAGHWATWRRLGTAKAQGAADAQDDNMQRRDSLHVQMAIQGAFAPLPDHRAEGALVLARVAGTTTTHVPVGENDNPFEQGEEITDAGWTSTRTGFALGMGWRWLDRVRGVVAAERVARSLDFDAAAGAADHEAVDGRLGAGVELGHTLLPALRDAVDPGTAFALRLGWDWTSREGLERRPGWFATLTQGLEPSPSWNFPAAAPVRPGLPSDAWALHGGLGASLRGGRLGADINVARESWTLGGHATTGWTFGLSVRLRT